MQPKIFFWLNGSGARGWNDMPCWADGGQVHNSNQSTQYYNEHVWNRNLKVKQNCDYDENIHYPMLLCLRKTYDENSHDS
jgi:hypothetical protein